jgi:hypothetical protein
MSRTSKTFRVFVSSTFTDMRAERRILQEEVFHLKTYRHPDDPAEED